MWIVNPAAMVSMYLPTWRKTSGPISATARARRAKTPIGNSLMTAVVSFIITWKPASKPWRSRSAVGPVITPSAAPKQIEKKISPRMSKLAAAPIGLSGISRWMMSMNELGVSRVAGSTGSMFSGNSSPSPGRMLFARVRPTRIAARLLNPYQPRVFAPSRPIDLPSPIPATPWTIEVKIRGTMTILSSRMKVSATHAIQVTSPKTSAKHRPSAIPIRTCQ